MSDELRQADGKQTYDPPRLTNISLRPEEAVLGHCKTISTGGPAQTGSCFPLCNSSLGS
jgi:hypothetical protein